MKEEIIKLCDLIIENKKCKNCGGDEYETGSCIYCHTENKQLSEIVSKILEIIDNVELDIDILFVLKSIDFVNCEKIQNILQQNNFDIYLKNKFNMIDGKIKNNIIDKDDLKYIFYFIDNKYYTEEDIGHIVGFIMSKLMIKKLNISLEEKLKFVKTFTETNIKVFYPLIKNPKCIFEDKEDDTIADSLYNIITMDKNKITKYLENDNYVPLLIIIFHECAHCLQKYRMTRKDFVSYNNLLNAKEEIISQKIPNYYDQNYNKLSHEVDARYTSYQLTLMYLDAKNIQLDKSGLEFLKGQMEIECKLFLDESRTLNGEKTTIDEIFENIEINYALFQKYPVLSFEYKYVDGKVIRKTKEEIEADYASFIPNEEVDYLYNKLLDKVETKMKQ